MCMTIVEQSGGQYHILLIIADGQVTSDRGCQLSPQEQKTVEAIVERVPLSIIIVEVGDGPWDMMRKFCDNIPARAFNNFHFVNFTEIMSKKYLAESQKEMEFALIAALMKIPSQYKATLELNILGFVPFASVIRKTWALAVGIRHVATVDKTFSCAQFVKSQPNQNKAPLSSFFWCF